MIKSVEYELYDVAFDFLMKYGIDINIIVKNEEHCRSMIMCRRRVWLLLISRQKVLVLAGNVRTLYFALV